MKNKKLLLTFTIVFILAISLFVMTACNKSGSLSAYEIAVQKGFCGTEKEWIDSLKGETVYTDSAYKLAVEYGYEGSEEQWLASLKGDKGERGETDISNAVNKTLSSVVSINAFFTQTTYSYNPFGGKTQESVREYASAGSGVIFDDDKTNGDAYIITNYHVIFDNSADDKISKKIYVYLYGMEMPKYKIQAEYVGGSMTYDIAVLKISESDVYGKSNAKRAVIGKSSAMSAGDRVIAIGNPKGSGISVTSGIVSLESEYIDMTAADASTKLSFRVMRIDAAINGGNSGGGIFNDSGELVGIVNAKIVDENIEGMAFAIPIDLAYSAAQNILINCDGNMHTSIIRYLLGITVAVTDSWTEIDAVTNKISIKNEVSVIGVTESYPAASAGIQTGDVIKSIRYNSVLYPVDREYDITDLSLLFKEGDSVIINLVRDDIERSISLTMNSSVTVK